MAINNSTNAALEAIRILGAVTSEYREKMKTYQLTMEKLVKEKADLLKDIGIDAYLTKSDRI